MNRICLQLGLALLVLVVFSPAPASGDGSLGGGETRIEIDPDVAAALGLRVRGAPHALGAGAAFPVDPASTLALEGSGNDVEGFGAGALLHDGLLLLRAGDARLRLGGFVLVRGARALDLELRDAAGRHWLDVRSPHLRVSGDQLRVRDADLLIAPLLARELGQPALAGTYLGRVEADWELEAPVRLLAGVGGGRCDPDFVNPPDVALTGVDSISQAAREPGGRIALSFAATLRNDGVGSVPWFRSIAPDDGEVGPHPFLALAFYRLADGVLEQIGRSDVKHAFFALNEGCPCPGDQILYSGCSDVYGVNTNLNRDYLAPRAEIDIATRSWESLGSHFDGVPVDDFRSHDEDSHADDFEHRLVVREPDLEIPGARYFAEAWYVVAGDTQLLNSVGHREVTPDFLFVWSFPELGGLVSGSIVDEFVDPAAPAPGQATQLVDTGEGQVQLAVDATDLGGGRYRYEYVVMNFDLARRVNSVSLPLAPGRAISQAVYRDGDADPGNDWSVSVANDSVTWTAPAGGALDWGVLAGFGFETNAAPIAGAATLGPQVPGAPSSFAVDTLVPADVGDDADGDGIADAADVCPHWPDDQTDSNGDGRGDACECGDQSGDGAVNIIDILEINAAIFDPALAAPLCDANDDGACDINDILAVNTKIFGGETYCARSPAP